MPVSIVRRFCAAAVVFGVAGTAFTLLSSTSAGADPSSGSWDRLRACESSGNYHSVDASGTHFGAYQFDQSTWNSVGGQGGPENATGAEQDYRALYLYRMRGWQPWQCADSAHLNLQNDADARTGRVPSYAESSRLRTGGDVSPATSVEPPQQLPPPKAATAAPTVRAVAPPPPPVAAAPVAAAPARPAAAPVPPVPTSPLGDIIPPAGSGTLVEPTLPVMTITYGMCSPILANWQVQMNRYGYDLDGAGCYDDQTASAAHQLQYANGIQNADTIGPYTFAAAYVGRAPR